MRKRDIRSALLLDHLHGRLYQWVRGGLPQFYFLPEDLPKDLDDIDNPDVEYTVSTDRDEQVQYFFEEAIKKMDGSTEIFLVGPGTAKHQLANELAERPAFKDVPVRKEASEWMDEAALEKWARNALRIPDDVTTIYLNKGAPRRRLGGPGAPVDPEDYQRTNDLKKVVYMSSRRAGD